MTRWIYRITMRDLLDDKEDAASVNEKKEQVALRLLGLASTIYNVGLKQDLEQLAEDFRAVPEEANLDAFNYELNNMWNVFDAYKVWVELDS